MRKLSLVVELQNDDLWRKTYDPSCWQRYCVAAQRSLNFSLVVEQGCRMSSHSHQTLLVPRLFLLIIDLHFFL